MPSSPASFSTASRITPSVEPHPTSVTAALSGPKSFGGAMSLIAACILRPRFSTIIRRMFGLVNSSLIQRAVFVVLIGGRGEDVTGHAGHRARRDTALGVLETEVSLVVVAAGGIAPLYWSR